MIFKIIVLISVLIVGSWAAFRFFRGPTGKQNRHISSSKNDRKRKAHAAKSEDDIEGIASGIALNDPLDEALPPSPLTIVASKKKPPKLKTTPKIKKARPQEQKQEALELLGALDSKANLGVSSEKSAPTQQSKKFSAPRIVPVTAACKLGKDFINYLLDNHFYLPRSQSPNHDQDLQFAFQKLSQEQPDVALPHGGVVCLLNPGCALIIDPLLAAVEELEATLQKMDDLIGDAKVFMVLGELPQEESISPTGGIDAHISAFVRYFEVQPTDLLTAQIDGSYHSELEVQDDFVPALLNLDRLPEDFVSSMLSYCTHRCQDGEPEAALRVLGPCAKVLWTRSVAEQPTFDAVLSAQVLNLVGVANRDIGDIKQAYSCFESALDLLHFAQEGDGQHTIHKNLAEMLLDAPIDEKGTNLKSASSHLRAAVQFESDDLHSWQLLGESYMRRFELLGKKSMLDGARQAYTSALMISPDDPFSLEAMAIIDAPLSEPTQYDQGSPQEHKFPMQSQHLNEDLFSGQSVEQVDEMMSHETSNQTKVGDTGRWVSVLNEGKDEAGLDGWNPPVPDLYSEITGESNPVPEDIFGEELPDDWGDSNKLSLIDFHRQKKGMKKNQVEEKVKV